MVNLVLYTINFKLPCFQRRDKVIYHNLVTYPEVSFSKDAADTTVNLFDQEMKYMHDNGFTVLTTSNLGYDSTKNALYIKSVSSGGNQAA
jgi:hypothetical protein